MSVCLSVGWSQTSFIHVLVPLLWLYLLQLSMPCILLLFLMLFMKCFCQHLNGSIFSFLYPVSLLKLYSLLHPQRFCRHLPKTNDRLCYKKLLYYVSICRGARGRMNVRVVWPLYPRLQRGKLQFYTQFVWLTNPYLCCVFIKLKWTPNILKISII